MRSSLRFSLVFAFLASAPLFAGLFSPTTKTEVNVNVDLTEEGKKIALPSPGHPVFYFPIVIGYKELGATVAGDKKPTTTPIAKELGKALAAQGYLFMGTNTPSLLLVFYWGYMNPNIVDDTFFNESEMLTLVAGKATSGIGLSLNSKELTDISRAASEERYFVIVSAYDYASAREKKKILLWRARMSTPSNGVNLEEVLPAMIASGGPHFGRETLHPTWTTAPIVREGKVEVGAPVVAPESAPKANPEAGKKP